MRKRIVTIALFCSFVILAVLLLAHSTFTMHTRVAPPFSTPWQLGSISVNPNVLEVEVSSIPSTELTVHKVVSASSAEWKLRGGYCISLQLSPQAGRASASL